MKGNRFNEDWQLFRDEHKAFYTDQNPSRLDAAIEKYVREHSDDMLSTVLLLVDYSDHGNRDKLGKLLKDINIEARPESLTRLFVVDPLNRKKVNLPRLTSLTLWKHGGGFEEVKLTDRVTLLTLWAQPQKDREALRTKVQTFKETTDGKAHLVDILADTIVRTSVPSYAKAFTLAYRIVIHSFMFTDGLQGVDIDDLALNARGAIKVSR